MACVPSTLVANAKAFAGLDDRQMSLAMIGLLRQWAATANPGADLSPAALVDRAKQFSGLVGSPQDAQLVIVQLLCNIRG